LQLLATNEICTLEQMVICLWGYDGKGDLSSIKGCIYHLRQKIEPDPRNPQYLLTLPGVGYRLKRQRTEE
jgi:DNA-binding response OmpR family regulator